MECYLIRYQGKRYATDADNILEAETKFIECYDPELEDFLIDQIELTPALRADESVIWF